MQSTQPPPSLPLSVPNQSRVVVIEEAEALLLGVASGHIGQGVVDAGLRALLLIKAHCSAGTIICFE